MKKIITLYFFSLFTFIFLGCQLFIQPSVTAISIETMPDKITYFQNDLLDLSGLVLHSVYSDGKYEIIDNFSSIPEEGTAFTEPGKQKITLFANGKKTYFTVNVIETKLSLLQVISFPNKQIFKYGETISLDGLILSAEYNNGIKKYLNQDNVVIKPDLNTIQNKVGKHELSITYEERTITLPITIQEKEPEFAETPIILKNPDNFLGFVGETTVLSVEVAEISEGQLFYQWYKADSQFSEFSIIAGENSKNLVIENDGNEMQKFYYVLIKNFCDGKNSTSTTSSTVNVRFLQPLKILEQPNNTKFDLYEENNLPLLTIKYSTIKHGLLTIDWHMLNQDGVDVLLNSETIGIYSDNETILSTQYQLKSSDFKHEITSKNFYCIFSYGDGTSVTSRKITLSQSTTGNLAPFPLGRDNPSGNLDFIFNLETLGITTINITRSEWNTLLDNYDIFPKNEVNVHADYQYEKDGYSWKAYNSGLRIRGNTSRKRPETLDGEYSQAHFQIDFEEFTEDKYDAKIAGCMKSITLKRFKDDPTYVREIYGYDFMRHYGVWTAPRACYTRLLINITDEITNTTESVNYGIYEMVEHVNKQYLKERTNSLNTSSVNSYITGGNFSSSQGDLWKCWRAFLSTEQKALFGVENVTLDKKSLVNYNYSLKTNKENLNSAKNQLSNFISELSNLDTSTDEAAEWYKNIMDVDLFIKTYAIQQLVGNGDEYWTSGNNFYISISPDGYFTYIPYDMDSILAYNTYVRFNPLNPPLLHTDITPQRPLIQKILEIPEFRKIYIDYLYKFVVTDDYFSPQESKKRILKWQNLIKDYIDSDQLYYSDTYNTFRDFFLNEGRTSYKLLSDNDSDNTFAVRIKYILKYIEPEIANNE